MPVPVPMPAGPGTTKTQKARYHRPVLWVLAIGLLLLVQLMPYFFRLIVAAALRCRPIEYTRVDVVPTELKAFRD